MIKKCFCLMLMFMLAKMLHATSITSVQCGAWTAPSTWDLNRVPQPGDTIIVNTFVSFDTDFTSTSPGFLDVTICGTLCGLHSYTGHFVFRGVVYMNTVTANYGASASYSSVNIQQMVTVTGMGTSYTQYTGTTCVGCTSHCQNCSTNNRADSLNCSQNGIELLATPYILVYPNPVQNKITLKSESRLGDVFLYDTFGVVVRKYFSDQDRAQLDAGDLPAGIYVIAVAGRHYRILKE